MRSLLAAILFRPPSRCGFCGLPDIHEEETFCSEECEHAWAAWRSS